jgi:hypothetical protein
VVISRSDLSADQVILGRMWKVAEGPTALRSTGDYFEWLWLLESDSGDLRRVLFRVTGTANGMAPECLPPRVREAVQSTGRSELGRMSEWPELPAVMMAGSNWIELQHRNELLSRVGQRPPEGRDPGLNALALINRSTISVHHGQGVKTQFQFNLGHWTEALVRPGGSMTSPEPVQLSDVLGALQGHELDYQRALDMDPKGAAGLTAAALLARP